ncbi:MAG: MFS transporter [Verrucomicrobiota bacterium]
MPLLTEQNRKWWILAAMGGVLGLVVLDEMVVGVALPTMRRDLSMSEITSHWVVNAYLLVFTCLSAVGGKLGDIFNIRRLICIGVAIFGVASLACGLASSPATLITARAVQGLGAAIIFPNGIALINQVFPPEQRGLAFGIQTACGGTFMALGPLVGGFFTETLSWRWIFWINIPAIIIITLILILAKTKDEAQSGSRKPFDFLGLSLLIPGLTALVLGFMQAPDWGWTSTVTLSLLAGGAVVTTLFVITELRKPSPLIELDLLKVHPFFNGNYMIFVAQIDKATLVVFGALYIQRHLDMTALQAGLALTPAVIPLTFVAIIAGKFCDRFGNRGPALYGAGMNAAAIIAFGIGATFDSYYAILPALLMWGCSLPFVFVPARHALMSAIPHHKSGQAGGINLTAQFLGSTVGITIGSALLAMTQNFPLIFLVAGSIAMTSLITTFFSKRATHPSSP